MTLTVIPSVFNSKVIDVSGVSMKFDVDNYGKVTALSVLDNDVDVWIVTGSVAGHFVNVCNIQWISLTGTLGFDLGWRTSPTDSLQTESMTYLPTPASGTLVQAGVDYIGVDNTTYSFLGHLSQYYISNVETFNGGTDKLYAYFVYPSAAGSIARRIKFIVSGSSVSSSFMEVNLGNNFGGQICKDLSNDDILYLVSAPNIVRINFSGGTYTTQNYGIASGGVQSGRYVYYTSSNVSNVTAIDYHLNYSYNKLDILTGTITTHGMGYVTLPGRGGIPYYKGMFYITKPRINGGIAILNGYISDGQEIGVIYGADSVDKAVIWNIDDDGGNSPDYYAYMGQRAPAGFTGNAGSSTHLMGFISAWNSDRLFSGYAHFDDVGGVTLSIQNVDYESLGYGYNQGMAPPGSVYSSRYRTVPYYMANLDIRSGIDTTIYHTLVPADYGCSALYTSWISSWSSGIQGNVFGFGGNTRDDIDDCIYIHGKKTTGEFRMLGINEDGTLIKELDIIADNIYSGYGDGDSIVSSTSNGMLVNKHIWLDRNNHKHMWINVRYYLPLNPDYER